MNFRRLRRRATFARGIRRQHVRAASDHRWCSPSRYACCMCGARYVRLYRSYGGFLSCNDLRCNAHVPDNRGWWVPLVEASDGRVWGYISCPEADIERWRRLPERSPAAPGWSVNDEWCWPHGAQLSLTGSAPAAYFEVEGAGPDKFVRATGDEAAARAAASYQATRGLDSLEWLDTGSGAGTVARYAWEAGDDRGRVTVRGVSPEQAAALDALALGEGECVEAAEWRAASSGGVGPSLEPCGYCGGTGVFDDSHGDHSASGQSGAIACPCCATVPVRP
jgi:hypothetical protein